MKLLTLRDVMRMPTITWPNRLRDDARLRDPEAHAHRRPRDLLFRAGSAQLHWQSTRGGSRADRRLPSWSTTCPTA